MAWECPNCGYQQSAGGDAIMIPGSMIIDGHRMRHTEAVSINTVCAIRSEDKYTFFQTDAKREVMVEWPIKMIMAEWPGRFLRIHRSVAVATNRIERIVQTEIGPPAKWGVELDNGKRYPIARRHVARIKRELHLGGRGLHSKRKLG